MRAGGEILTAHARGSADTRGESDHRRRRGRQAQRRTEPLGPTTCSRRCRCRSSSRGISATLPDDVRAVAEGLHVPRLHDGRPARRSSSCGSSTSGRGTKLVPDNWIYIQEPRREGRPAADLQQLEPVHGRRPGQGLARARVLLQRRRRALDAVRRQRRRVRQDELAKIDIVDPADVVDATVSAMPKTYPAYFGAYDRSTSCGRGPTDSRTSSSSAAMACTSTTTRTTRC